MIPDLNANDPVDRPVRKKGFLSFIWPMPTSVFESERWNIYSVRMMRLGFVFSLITFPVIFFSSNSYVFLAFIVMAFIQALCAFGSLIAHGKSEEHFKIEEAVINRLRYGRR
jgi:hypothetical protein